MLTSAVIYKQRPLHETKLGNYFITTNVMALTKAVLPRTQRTTTLKRPVHFYQPLNL